MRLVFLIFIQALALSAGIQGALANGAPYVAASGMGGIKFQENKFISIDEEVLHIGGGEIHVSYTFRSSSPQPITLDIAFPTARTDTEGPEFWGSLPFKLTADGKDVTTQRRVVYFRNEQELSGVLERAKVPQSKIDKNFQFILSDEAKSALKEQGVEFFCEEDGKTCWIGDEAQEVFTWRQVFKPGLTRIEVSYTPRVGTTHAIMYRGGDDEISPKEKKDFRDKFCIDKPVERALQKEDYWDGYTVEYIWATARYWNGPIKNFHLIIEKDKAHDIVSYCPTVGQKTSPTRFEWHTTDFVPKGKLTVLFVPGGSD